MTAPTFTPPPKDFGPDFTKTKEDPELKPPKINEKHPPKPGIIGNLGQNKKARSGIRALSEEDIAKLAGWYRVIGRGVEPFRPQLGQAIVQQSNDCAQSWAELAVDNDKVRKGILWLVEGGAWGKLAFVHAPIILAALPESVVERAMFMWMRMFAEEVQAEEDTNSPLYYPAGNLTDEEQAARG